MSTDNSLMKLGKVKHISDMGNAIIFDPPQLPKIGSDVINEQMEHVGKVNDIFGPVKHPYVSVKLKEDFRNKVVANVVLYSIQRKNRRKQSKKKRNRKQMTNKAKYS